MRIRSHLLLLAFGIIVPITAFSVFLTTLLVEREQRTFAEGAVERLLAEPESTWNRRAWKNLAA